MIDLDCNPKATVVFQSVTGADFVTVDFGHDSLRVKVMAKG
jgi:hypothetical protein